MSESVCCRSTAYRAGSALFIVILALAVGMISGCRSDVSPDTGSPAVIVDYRRSGGIAGVMDRLIVYANRRATITRKVGEKEVVLDQKTFDRLVQQLDQAQFAKLKPEYLPINPCCDLFEYEITYQGHTVRTMDNAVPEELRPVLKTLNEIVQSQ